MFSQISHFARYPAVIAGVVLLLHVMGLTALQSGLLVRVYELVVPVEMIAQIIEPPAPIVSPPRPPAPTPLEPTKVNKAVTLLPAPQPLAVPEPTRAQNAQTLIAVSPAAVPLITAPITAPVVASPSPAPAAAVPAPAPEPSQPAPKIELPRADADYINNPKPPYPAASFRMGEQGRVMVRVYVGEDGLPQKSELRTSSGFDRLDATAVATVMRWRFRPGMRGGAPEAMWVNVPIDFTLDN
jgi:periplasmic protein TonB